MGRIILLIVFAILLLILILLFSPVKIFVSSFEGDTKVGFRYLFFKFKRKNTQESETDSGQHSEGEEKAREVSRKSLRKSKDDKKEKKPKKESTEKNSGEKTGIMPRSAGEAISLIKDLYEPGKKSLKIIFIGIKIRDLVIDFTISDQDAYDCAIKFGKTNIVVYNALGFLNCIFSIKKKSINIKCRFNEPESVYNYSFTVKFRPACAIHAAAGLIFAFLVNNIKKRKRLKADNAA